jgi:DNA-directed RNA polymerase specialized sigma24 family protein
MSEGRFADSQHQSTGTSHSSASKQSGEQAEQALLARISAGDRSAMDELYLLYFARLANFFRHLTMHAHLVEELINDTMYELWQEGASIGENASVSVAIMGLAYSRGPKRFAEARAIRPHVQRAIDNADHESSLPAMLEPSNPQDSLLKLPVEERAVLHLVYSGGHSRRDIADIMNISCECVDLLLGDARLRLRRAYAQGHVAGDSSC